MLWFGRKERLPFRLAAASGAILVLLVTALAAWAQTVTFSSIEVRGNERVEDETILSYAGIVPGQQVSAGQVNSAYQRILNSNLFEAVEIDTRGGRLVIDVQEYPTINEIAFEGNQRLTMRCCRGWYGRNRGGFTARRRPKPMRAH